MSEIIGSIRQIDLDTREGRVRDPHTGVSFSVRFACSRQEVNYAFRSWHSMKFVGEMDGEKEGVFVVNKILPLPLFGESKEQ